MERPPEFAPGDIYGIAHGRFAHEDKPWETRIEMKEIDAPTLPATILVISKL